MNQPLFSVLIANYNNAQYIKEAIESVIQQTYSNWEIIIVDDYSTDNSNELYKQYAYNNRIKIYYNDKNQGCGYTKRRCVEMAQSEICGFLDPDDALMTSAIELMVNSHNLNPEVSLILSRFYFCDEDLIIQSESHYLSISEGNSYLTNCEYRPEHFVSFKKKYYNKTDGLSAQNKLGVDQDLIFRLEEVGKLLILKDLTYKYRLHDKSIASDKRKSFYWNLIVRHEACIRRGLDPELYPYKDYVYAFEHFALTEEKLIYINNIENELKKIKISKAYQIGKFFLKPISLFRYKILRK